MKDNINHLELYLLTLEEKYISPHQNPMESPGEYGLDVKSFCILAHAAFEEFLESLCIHLLDEVEEKFVNTQRVSYTSLCLLHFKGTDKDPDDDNWKDDDRLFDRLRNQIRDIKSSYSKYIVNNNHGINLKYLKKLLVPLGLDLPSDMREISSLDNLAKYRGVYAHTFQRKEVSISPEDAWTYVQDVYRMCMRLADDAKKVHYYAIH